MRPKPPCPQWRPLRPWFGAPPFSGWTRWSNSVSPRPNRAWASGLASELRLLGVPLMEPLHQRANAGNAVPHIYSARSRSSVRMIIWSRRAPGARAGINLHKNATRRSGAAKEIIVRANRGVVGKTQASRDRHGTTTLNRSSSNLFLAIPLFPLRHGCQKCRAGVGRNLTSAK